MESYWDLYVAYVHHCVENNKKYGIDPHHYKMEWNHFLPKCIFGDQPIGQYLLLKQHAIASSLQSLAFKRNCMFGWHKHYLPEYLLDLSWGIYCRNREKWGAEYHQNKTGIHSDEHIKRRGIVNQLTKSHKVEVIDLEGCVTEYTSLRSAARTLSISIDTVRRSVLNQLPIQRGIRKGYQLRQVQNEQNQPYLSQRYSL